MNPRFFYCGTRCRFSVAIVFASMLVGTLGFSANYHYQTLHPYVLCQMPLGNGETAAYFGYKNDQNQPFSPEQGFSNEVSPWAKAHALPLVFQPGQVGRYPNAAFVATFSPNDKPSKEELTWTLGRRVARLSDDTPRCPIPEMQDSRQDIAWVKPPKKEKPQPEFPEAPEESLELPPPPPPKRHTPVEKQEITKAKPEMDKPPTPKKESERPKENPTEAQTEELFVPEDGEDAEGAMLVAGSEFGQVGANPENASPQKEEEANSAPATKAPSEGGGGLSLQEWSHIVGPIIKRHLHYPPACEEDGIEGTTIIRVSMEPDGSIKQLKLRRTAGDARLDQAAMACLHRLKKLPPPPKEHQELDLPIEFQLP